ncbi:MULTISPECIES: hypothetical protein [unclassified Cupriavidus]|uniref:hypothetical protein n=1 Tax=unclassified Cupriavidus TaxID=2640874 RepID=UPI00313D2A6C
MTLDQFVEQERARLIAFERHWRAMNAVDPQNWPLDLGVGNAGLWDEMLSEFAPAEAPESE